MGLKSIVNRSQTDCAGFILKTGYEVKNTQQKWEIYWLRWSSLIHLLALQLGKAHALSFLAWSHYRLHHKPQAFSSCLNTLCKHFSARPIPCKLQEESYVFFWLKLLLTTTFHLWHVPKISSREGYIRLPVVKQRTMKTCNHQSNSYSVNSTEIKSREFRKSTGQNKPQHPPSPAFPSPPPQHLCEETQQ